MTSRTDRDHKTAKELFFEQAAAYFDDLTIAAIVAAIYSNQWNALWKNTYSSLTHPFRRRTKLLNSGHKE